MNEINALATEIRKLPKEQQRQLMPALKKVREGEQRRKRILQLVQDALSHLRLDMKYLAFDLKCTRRERDAAREKSS